MGVVRVAWKASDRRLSISKPVRESTASESPTINHLPLMLLKEALAVATSVNTDTPPEGIGGKSRKTPFNTARFVVLGIILGSPPRFPMRIGIRKVMINL